MIPRTSYTVLEPTHTASGSRFSFPCCSTPRHVTALKSGNVCDRSNRANRCPAQTRRTDRLLQPYLQAPPNQSCDFRRFCRIRPLASRCQQLDSISDVARVYVRPPESISLISASTPTMAKEPRRLEATDAGQIMYALPITS
jgi:hypothetical protein